jgi:predicted membrane chloride channel (bestrophin family)
MQSTLKININKEKEQRVKELLNTKKIDQMEAQRARGFKFFDPNLENKQNKREKMRLNAFKFSEMDNKLNDMTAMVNKNAPIIIPEKNSDLKILIENHFKQVIYLNLINNF